MNEEEFKAVENLEKGKDYISVSESVIVIDRKSNSYNNGFEYSNFVSNIACDHPIFWREATHEEVKKRFETYLAKRYGADWKTMKIKERHPESYSEINEGSLDAEIVKMYDGWNVWNENGLLYCEGIWVERLEEEEIRVNLKAWDELVKDAPQSTFGQKIKKEAYIEGFNAGRNYVKDSVNLTVSNDALAATFQSLRHYRENLIKWIEKL